MSYASRGLFITTLSFILTICSEGVAQFQIPGTGIRIPSPPGVPNLPRPPGVPSGIPTPPGLPGNSPAPPSPGAALNLGRQVATAIFNGVTRMDPRQMGRDLDQIRLRFAADVYSGPTLALWIQQSRDSSWPNAQSVPPEVQQALQGWFSDDLFNNVRWKIGDGGAINLANATLTYGTAEAICLIDTIVFKDAQVASDLSVWAHEMVHVQQFRALGVNTFAANYARSSNSLENPAYDLQNRFAASPSGGAALSLPPPPIAAPPPPPRLSSVCRYGPQPMAYCIIPSMGMPGGYCGCGPQGVPVGRLQ